MINGVAGTRLRLLSAGAGMALAISGCKPVTEACAAYTSPALVVTARDSVSGALIPNAIISASMGTLTDSAVVGPAPEYPVLLASSAGTYEVSVRAPGYTTWTSTQTVAYTNQACGHIAPLAFTALMQGVP